MDYRLFANNEKSAVSAFSAMLSHGASHDGTLRRHLPSKQDSCVDFFENRRPIVHSSVGTVEKIVTLFNVISITLNSVTIF